LGYQKKTMRGCVSAFHREGAIMASQWFYKVLGEHLGPVSGAELRNLAQRGVVAPDTLVTNTPNGDWVAAGRVRGLFPVPSAAPPVAPVVASALVDAKRSDPSTAPKPGRPGAASATRRLSRRLVAASLIGSVVLISVIVVIMLRSRVSKEPATRNESRVLRANGTTLEVRVWSTVLFRASGTFNGELYDRVDTFMYTGSSAPRVAFSYNCGDGSQEPTAGKEGLYVPVQGKPEKIQVAVRDPEICAYYSGALVPLAPGKTTFHVTLAEKSLEIPIEVIALPVKYGAPVDEILKAVGFPDRKTISGSSEFWTYKRWPRAVVMIGSASHFRTLTRTAGDLPQYGQQREPSYGPVLVTVFTAGADHQ
jgi:hypothetical protein